MEVVVGGEVSEGLVRCNLVWPPNVLLKSEGSSVGVRCVDIQCRLVLYRGTTMIRQLSVV